MSPPFPSPTQTWHQNTYPSLDPKRPELSAKGKSVLITGGGSGIGAETARYFAAAGASRIAILGRRTQPLEDTKASINEKYPDVEVTARSVDVTNLKEVDAFFADFAKSHAIDILISNASLIGPVEPIEYADIDVFLDVLHGNIKRTAYVAKAFLRHAAPNATVVNVSSSAAHFKFTAGLPSYQVAKLALTRLWDTIAIGKPEWNVFHLHPGVVDTAMNREVDGIKAAGTEDHVSLPASFMVWLAGSESRFLKNKFLWANWDVDELKARAKELEGSQDLTIDLVGWPWGSTFVNNFTAVESPFTKFN